MVERNVIYFERAGEENTQKTLELVEKYKKENNIDQILIATTYGDTALLASKKFENLICVLHQYGFKGEGKQCLDQDIINKIEKNGAKALINTDVFTTVGRAFRSVGFSQMDIVSKVYRTFSQGVKVAVEIAIMAADCGLIPTNKKVISIGGTNRGADTAILITPKDISRLFEIKIHEIICKPNLS